NSSRSRSASSRESRVKSSVLPAGKRSAAVTAHLVFNGLSLDQRRDLLIGGRRGHGQPDVQQPVRHLRRRDEGAAVDLGQRPVDHLLGCFVHRYSLLVKKSAALVPTVNRKLTTSPTMLPGPPLPGSARSPVGLRPVRQRDRRGYPLVRHSRCRSPSAAS